MGGEPLLHRRLCGSLVTKAKDLLIRQAVSAEIQDMATALKSADERRRSALRSAGFAGAQAGDKGKAEWSSVHAEQIRTSRSHVKLA